MTLSPRTALIGAGAAALLLLPSCSQFNAPPTGSQQDVIGPVWISAVVCTFGFGSAVGVVPSSPSDCDNGTTGTGRPPTGQYLVGYLVPETSTAPDALTSPDLPGVAFMPSPSYVAGLEALQPAPTGMRWVGYRSDVVSSTAPMLVRLDADFGLPAGALGDPFEGPLAIKQVIGDREVDSTLLADRPVDCSEQRPNGGGTEMMTACVADTATISVATRDLALAPGPATTAQPGDKVWVPFDAVFRGSADPAATFALSATTNLPGARALPSRTTFTPATNGSASQTVEVVVPDDTPTGDYDVTLVARVGGQARAATATLRVERRVAPPPSDPPAPSYPPPAPPPAPLEQSLAPLRPPTPSALLGSGVPVTVGCTTACTTTVDVLVYGNRHFRRASAVADRPMPDGRTVLAARQRVARAAAGASDVRVRLGRDVAAVLRHVRAFTVVVRATSVDEHGRRRTDPAVHKLHLRHVCRRHSAHCVAAGR